MKISVDIPADIEKLLLKKCEELRVSPSEFVYALLEWYFIKRKSERIERGDELLKYAKKYGMEKLKYCKYSDGNFCALDALEDLERELEPLNLYKCLFCTYFVDKRKEIKVNRKVDESRIYDLAKLAAKLVVELYGDRIGYIPKKRTRSDIDSSDVKRLLENW